MTEDDLDRELRVHLEIEAQEQQERGLPEDEARYAAQRALGSQVRIKEDVRALSRWAPLDSIGRDAHYALRMIRTHPTFALTVIMTLTVGVAAST